jgi:1,4-dihydroxy-2-naphthoate octaprenyltransferase
MASLSNWIQAFRLRTLPLAFSSIGMGALLAYQQQVFNGPITILAFLTTLCLQILSNLSNDYGDSIHGADSDQREGPQRMVQKGVISLMAMKRAMYIASAASLLTGCTLLYFTWEVIGTFQLLLFFLLGITCIAAAIKYTAGNNPYGYLGLGDLFVFIFFGLAGVLGTYFIQANEIHTEIVLYGIIYGLLSTAVLNVNNLRDISSDALVGKQSIPVRIGFFYGKLYHLGLIGIAMVMGTYLSYFSFKGPFWNIALLAYPLFIYHLIQVFRTENPKLLDLSILFYTITIGITFYLNQAF